MSELSSSISNVLVFAVRYWYLWAIIIGVTIVIFFILKRRRVKEEEAKDFKIPELKDTTREGLKKSFELFGKDTKDGKIYRSYQKIADIKRHFRIKGNFDIQYFDKKTKEFVNSKIVTKKEEETEDKTTYYDLLLAEVHNKFFLWRILGIKTTYFILKWADKEGNTLLNFNPMTESIILNSETDLTNYADVWTNCDEGIEYITNVSMIRLNERLQALLDSTPDKYVFLEMETAKLKNKMKIITESERAKYKEREEAGDTTIV